MKPAWAEVKKAIREIVCPSFLPLGFKNPGRTMYRHREQFVDVVHFYYNGNMTGFAIELGCHPRKAKPLLPKPWTCIFRTRICHPDQKICRYSIYSFADTIDEQKYVLHRLAPYVGIQASAWFSQFETILDAIDFLTNANPQELANLMLAGKGSLAYQEYLAILQAAASVA